MDNYSSEQIQARYNKLPDDIKQAMNSVDTTKAIVEVGEKHDLMYDQIEAMVEEVTLIMLGFVPAERFVGDMSRVLRIDTGKSLQIARDVNSEVFDKMRKSLQKIESANDKEDVQEEQEKPEISEPEPSTESDAMTQNSVISAVEKAGGFVIDKPGEANSYDQATEKPASKEAVLNEIEREPKPAPQMAKAVAGPAMKTSEPLDPEHLLEDKPETGQAAPAAPAPIPASLKNKQGSPMSIIDTLLSKGVAIPMDDGAAGSSSKPAPERKNASYTGSDPYREPIN